MAAAPDSERTLRIVRDSFPDRAAFDTAVSRAVLLRVAAGELGPTMRLHRPGATLAFGRRDALSAGYPEAVRAARSAGYEAVERLAGGRAAVFSEDTLMFGWALADSRAALNISRRFEEAAAIVAAALRTLGVDAHVGEVPGEYCAGAHSVNARGRSKLMGVGQRVIAGAAYVGAVIVVRDKERVRDVLLPVYAALGLSFDPETVGSVADELGEVQDEQLERALVGEVGRRYELVEGSLDQETLALAERLEPEHEAPTFSGEG